MARRKRSTEEWAAKYGRTHNERRRARYHSDPEYAEAQRALRRASNARMKALADGSVVRTVNGQQVRVYRTAPAANRAGITLHRFLYLREKGVIPKHSVPGKQATYTDYQIELIRAGVEKQLSDDQLRLVLANNWYGE